MKKEDFSTLVDSRIVLLDGAMGTNLYLAGMPRGVSTEDWILQHEDVVLSLQKEYVEAGSDIIYAPSFGANRHVLSTFGLEQQVREMNAKLVDISHRASGGKCLVAGDVAPTGLILESDGGEHSVDEVFEIYAEQIRILAENGVDLIVAETMMSVNETMIALDAATSVCDLPVMCSLSVTADGRGYYGGTVQEAAAALPVMGACAVGVNCCSGPDQLESIVRSICSESTAPVLAKPNAGMPRIDDNGKAVYEMTPAAFAVHMAKLIEAGARIVGGCCGTTPAHIRKLHELISGSGKLVLPKPGNRPDVP